MKNKIQLKNVADDDMYSRLVKPYEIDKVDNVIVINKQENDDVEDVIATNKIKRMNRKTGLDVDKETVKLQFQNV